MIHCPVVELELPSNNADSAVRIRWGFPGEGRTSQRRETGVVRPVAETQSPSPGKEVLDPPRLQIQALPAGSTSRLNASL